MTLKLIDIGQLVLSPDVCIQQQLNRIEAKVNSLMASAQAFQDRLDQINANTTASAAAAQHIADNDAALKKQLDEILTSSGVPAAVEDAILAKLDTSIAAGAALKTFLEATASGPVSGPAEPAPVPAPVPAPDPPPVV